MLKTKRQPARFRVSGYPEAPALVGVRAVKCPGFSNRLSCYPTGTQELQNIDTCRKSELIRQSGFRIAWLTPRPWYRGIKRMPRLTRVLYYLGTLKLPKIRILVSINMSSWVPVGFIPGYRFVLLPALQFLALSVSSALPRDTTKYILCPRGSGLG